MLQARFLFLSKLFFFVMRQGESSLWFLSSQDCSEIKNQGCFDDTTFLMLKLLHLGKDSVFFSSIFGQGLSWISRTAGLFLTYILESCKKPGTSTEWTFTESRNQQILSSVGCRAFDDSQVKSLEKIQSIAGKSYLPACKPPKGVLNSDVSSPLLFTPPLF